MAIMAKPTGDLLNLTELERLAKAALAHPDQCNDSFRNIADPETVLCMIARIRLLESDLEKHAKKNVDQAVEMLTTLTTARSMGAKTNE